jgi:hypothetical protein
VRLFRRGRFDRGSREGGEIRGLGLYRLRWLRASRSDGIGVCDCARRVDDLLIVFIGRRGVGRVVPLGEDRRRRERRREIDCDFRASDRDLEEGSFVGGG